MALVCHLGSGQCCPGPRSPCAVWGLADLLCLPETSSHCLQFLCRQSVP